MFMKHSIPLFVWLLLWGPVLGVRVWAQEEIPGLSFVSPQDGQTISGPNVLVWVAEEQPSEELPCRAAVIFETSLNGQEFDMHHTEEVPEVGQCAHTTALDTTVLPARSLFLRARVSDESTGPVIQVFVRRLPEVSCAEPVSNPNDPFLVSFDCSASQVEEGQIVLYRWDFGEESILETTRPTTTHRYPDSGLFFLQLTVVDDEGLSSTLFTTVSVGP
jgi:hypothetical protein